MIGQWVSQPVSTWWLHYSLLATYHNKNGFFKTIFILEIHFYKLIATVFINWGKLPLSMRTDMPFIIAHSIIKNRLMYVTVSWNHAPTPWGSFWQTFMADKIILILLKIIQPPFPPPISAHASRWYNLSWDWLAGLPLAVGRSTRPARARRTFCLAKMQCAVLVRNNLMGERDYSFRDFFAFCIMSSAVACT